MSALYERSGGEFLVNTSTLNGQQQPAITALASGGFVMTWVDASLQGGDSSSSSIKAQVYDAAGNKIGSEFLVNTATLNGQTAPSVAAVSSGGFIVTWSDFSGQGGDASNSSIKAQIFNASGAKLGSEFLVNTSTFSGQVNPSIATFPSGNFVIAWQDASGQGGDSGNWGVKAQLFNAAGSKLGAEFVVNTTVLNSQTEPSVTALASGGFVVCWNDDSAQVGDTSSIAVRAQIFDAAGAKLGAEFLVNTTTLNAQFRPAVASLPSGGFVITWEDGSRQGADPYDASVKAQIFDPAGAKMGTEFLVNTAIWNGQGFPAIASLPSGGFIITWGDGSGSNGDPNAGVGAQVFAANGSRVGTEFLVNSVTAGTQGSAAVAVLNSGRFVIGWMDGSSQGADTSVSSIKGQIFSSSGGTITDLRLSTDAVPETAIENLAVADLAATGAVNASFSYVLLSDSSNGGFRIEGNRLVVADTKKLDHEAASTVTLGIRAQDSSGNSYDEVVLLNIADSVDETRFAAGTEFLVNTTTLNNQQLGSVASLTSGGFILTWTDSSGVGGDAADGAIKAQLFSASGDKVGPEFLVNSTTVGQQYGSSATALASGGFVVTWGCFSQTGGDISSGSIRAQMFDASGSKIGAELVVNSTTSGNQVAPKITALASGGFVVTWRDDSGLGGDANIGVKAQIFDSSGAKLGAEFLVNSTTANQQDSPAVGALQTGGFVVSWTEFTQFPGDGLTTHIRAQVFDAAGGKVGAELIVNTHTAFDQLNPTITTLASGRFIVSWQDASLQGGDASSRSVKAQIFEASGTKVGSEFLVNTSTTGSQGAPAITALPSGGFLVSWADESGEGGDGGSASIKAQLFDAGGAKVGTEFLVNSATFGNQHTPQIAALNSGGFVVGWTDMSGQAGDASGPGINARIFSLVEPNTAPEGSADFYPIDEDAVLTATAPGLLANDSDDDGDALAAALVSGPAHGALTLNADGSFSYTPDTNFNGMDSFVYRANDGSLASGDTIVTITVNAVNDAPASVTLQANAVDENAPGAVVGILGGTDPEGSALSFTVSDNRFEVVVNGGVSTLKLKNNVSLDHEAEAGDVVVNVTASDGQLSTTQAFTIGIVDKFVTINGTGGADIISATKTVPGQSLPGLENDRLYGLGGNDQLDGAAGGDRMEGGPGHDTYTVESAGDEVVETDATAAGGIDTVKASISYTLSTNVEKLILTGTAGINGTGNALGNTITGNKAANSLYGLDGNDVLNGGLGADYMEGGLGNDSYTIDNAGDIVFELPSEGTDIVKASVTHALAAEVEDLTLTGTAAIDGTGNGGNNKITGNSGANRLDGGGANDILLGGLGNDILLGGDGIDLLTGGDGLDTLTGGAGNDKFIFVKTTETALAMPDMITDFTQGEDRIDLSKIDANGAFAGSTAFVFIGTASFPGGGATGAGRLRYEQVGGETHIYGDVNGDGAADFIIKLDDLVNLTGADFVL